MIAYHCNANLILAKPFASRKDTHRLLTYDKIMQRLSDNKLIVDIQILDNEASAEYKRAFMKKWNASYQLVPTNTHWSNVASSPSEVPARVYFPGPRWNLILPGTLTRRARTAK